jgi:hypothetical protein
MSEENVEVVRRPLLRRATETLLFGLMVVGGFAVWTAVPGAILWGLGRMVDSKTQHFLLALITVPIGMAVFAALLVRLNVLYLRVNGFDVEDGEEWQLRSPLDRILVICSIIALVALLGWLVFAPNTRIGDCGCGL